MVYKHNFSLKEARSFIFSSQKLTGPQLTSLEIIEHLGYIQIDTISVVERAHHHIFWSRNPDYRPADLHDLVKKRKAFEYWSHAASYLPMSEYRYTLPMKKAYRQRDSRDIKTMTDVLKRIQKEGPLQSKDFENREKKGTGWWDWKPAKKALERLFMEGQLEISRREGFQKVYDLPERVIPKDIDTSMPTDKEYIQYLINRTLRHHGLASAAEIAYLFRKDIKDKVIKELQILIEDGKILEVKIENFHEPYFTLKKSLDNWVLPESKFHILSPFDNLVIQRKKLKKFFNYDYQIECYVPAPKRIHGYFCLPIFQNTEAIGRIDCKADRKNKILIVNSLHSENGKKLSSRFIQELEKFAQFNGCHTIQK